MVFKSWRLTNDKSIGVTDLLSCLVYLALHPLQLFHRQEVIIRGCHSLSSALYYPPEIPTPVRVAIDHLLSLQRNQHLDVDLRGDITDVIAAHPVLDCTIFHGLGVVVDSLFFAKEGVQNVSGVLDAVDWIPFFQALFLQSQQHLVISLQKSDIPLELEPAGAFSDLVTPGKRILLVRLGQIEPGYQPIHGADVKDCR